LKVSGAGPIPAIRYATTAQAYDATIRGVILAPDAAYAASFKTVVAQFTPTNRVAVLIAVVAVSGTTPTLNVRLLSSADPAFGSSSVAGTFPQITTPGIYWLDVTPPPPHVAWQLDVSIAGIGASFTFVAAIGVPNKTLWASSVLPPPGVPSAPAPADTATGVTGAVSLTWAASGATSYDVYFGTSNPPPLVSSDQSAASYTPGTLTAPTTYFWKIVARNLIGATTGAVWSFTTAAPPAPNTPSPADAATGVTGLSLTWASSGATSYDVYFGTSNPPPLVSSDQATASYTPGTLIASTTYFWKIVARNTMGSTTGAIWSFTTTTAAPASPNTPSPADTATDVLRNPTLTWQSARAAVFDVYLGTSNPPPLVASGVANASYTSALLAASTAYFFKVVATNIVGTTAGPVWSFTTGTTEAESVTVLTTTSTGNQNDFNPGALGTLNVLRCNNATALTITGLANGVDGQMVWIESIGTGQVDIKNQDAGSTAANRVINGVTGTISLAAGVGRALLCYDGTTARWRVLEHEQGAWIAVPFNAGDFTASSSSWTVASGDVQEFRYWLKGRTLAIGITLYTTTVGIGNARLFIKIPGGFSAAAIQNGPAGWLLDNAATYETCHFEILPATDATKVGFVRQASTVFTSCTDLMYLFATFAFEVQ